MSIKKTKDADIQYRKEDQFKDSDFAARNIGHRISIVIPEDVLMAYRQQASKQGVRYQTLMNQVLRNYVKEEENQIEERLKRLEKIVFNHSKAR